MKMLKMNLKNDDYPIIITNSFHDISKYLSKKFIKVIVISDSNVGKLYYYDVRSSLSKCCKEILYFEICAGESSKSIENTYKLYDFLFCNKVGQDDLIVGLGGGVVGDLVGFVAATYLYGIRLVHVPTSLLAQSDSSIGGKTGVNVMNIKNAVGAFYQPILVYSNYSVLNSLPIADIKNGVVEILVHAIIKDYELFSFIENNMDKILSLESEIMENLILKNCYIKKCVVEIDEKETGERAILNFGHTFGHAFESYYNYEYKHGECVAAGILGACYLAENLEMIDHTSVKRIQNIMVKLGVLRDFRGCEWEQIWDYLRCDKKRVSDKICFILPVAIGKVVKQEIEDISIIRKIFDRIIEFTCNTNKGISQSDMAF